MYWNTSVNETSHSHFFSILNFFNISIDFIVCILLIYFYWYTLSIKTFSMIMCHLSWHLKMGINGEENIRIHLKSLLSHKFYYSKNLSTQMSKSLSAFWDRPLLYYPHKIV